MKLQLAAITALTIVAGLLGGCKKKQVADLIVASPHSDQVQREFEAAFVAYCRENLGREIKLEWRNIGGTTEITNYLNAQYEKSDGSGIDIYFGGGAPDHKMLADRGVLEPVQLPAETLAQLPETIGGVRQRAADDRWFGACVSSFGILYNARLAEQRGVAAPAGWEDLASSEMLELVCTAGPKSGSARATYEMMIQSAGDWYAGWRRLLCFWANCKTFTQGASDVPSLVASGEVVAGTCIDYYAFNAITSPNGEVLRYSLPAAGSAFTPDPISLLKGAPNREMAEMFIQFVLSPEGQGLWCLPPGTPGGPQKYALYRQPIRRDAYAMYAGKMLDQLKDIFALSGGFELDERVQSLRVTYILPRLMRAAATDNAELLRRAWRKIVADGRREADVVAFTALPANIATQDKLIALAEQLARYEAAGDDKSIEQIEAGWREYFRQLYSGILGD